MAWLDWLSRSKARSGSSRLNKQDSKGAVSTGVGTSPSSRAVHMGPDEGGINPNAGFGKNHIKTAKYNVVTFLPIFLFTMFSRVAYLYFLAQAALAWWSVVSPFSPFGPTAALLFVLLVAAIKALVEDHKRHVEDRRTNNSVAHVVHSDGSVHDIKWRHVSVGMVLQVHDDEDFPADMLCLSCYHPDNVCYIKTTNLDGESNLKIRRPVDLKESIPEGPEAVMALEGTLHCEPPNPNLHSFVGKFDARFKSSGTETTVSVTMNEMLLRGCTLKNSGHVLGLVVYTGAETRIQMNAASPPRKLGSFDSFLNVQIALVIGLQLIMCFGCAIASLAWRHNYGYERWYLGLASYTQGNFSNPAAYLFIVFLTFWILFSYMVPISLFVTMEIVKFWLASVYIDFDPHMRDPETRQRAKARNSDMIEDLGMVQYVFSDKTGTLTSNEMRLRTIAIKGSAYSKMDFRLEDEERKGLAALEAYDSRLAQAAAALRTNGFWRDAVARGGSDANLLHIDSATTLTAEQSDLVSRLASEASFSVSQRQLTAAQMILGHHVLDFWTNVCLCHNLIVEKAPEGAKVLYQGPSPDEVALVEGGRQLGFEFVGRSRTDITISMLGHRVTHELLIVLDFSSDRARMSVVARSPDGTIRLYSKGSDAVMLPRLHHHGDAQVLKDTQDNLRAFSVQGLRTLVLASRVVPEQEYADWNVCYQEAASSLEGREDKVAAVAEDLERDLELLGVTAIEDKLQDGVPDAIQTLIDAGMKVWMITGDKQETAINIAISCQLIRQPDTLLMCNADSPEAARGLLQDLLHQVQERSVQHVKSHKRGPHLQVGQSQPAELVIDGKTLSYVLGTPAQELLASLAVLCDSVVVNRASPSQKAAIVRMMKRHFRNAEGVQRPRWQRLLLWPLLWLHRHNSGLHCRMLAIGDGANDVAMIQAADIGIGIMGKEGRQATNNSDYAISQFRFLVRLLLVHGTLTSYRLSRLIKYSFYKNITFAFMLFFLQLFDGFSGQALLDGITAAFYNAFFTALPIGAFALLDRPVRHMATLVKYPKLYNKTASLTARSFWKTAVLTAIAHGAVCFFIPYFSASASGRNSTDDLFSVGKTTFIAIIGVVSAELALVSRFWTFPFALVWALSYLLVYPFLVIIPLLYKAFGAYDVANGANMRILASGIFWLELVVVYITTFGSRYLERSIKWLWFPNDSMILAEREVLEDQQRKALGFVSNEPAAKKGSVELTAVPESVKLWAPNGPLNGSREEC
ncbi:hypothetical protein WJX72_009386 [[Myrmecia] bisecta]|uniref:Phospholipid-transporting ATPase n=1 Tax=[Myrmecia] bisecta TaxID=41462 RepID=A0AAW1PAY7_9CHLO